MSTEHDCQTVDPSELAQQQGIYRLMVDQQAVLMQEITTLQKCIEHLQLDSEYLTAELVQTQNRHDDLLRQVAQLESVSQARKAQITKCSADHASLTEALQGAVMVLEDIAEVPDRDDGGVERFWRIASQASSILPGLKVVLGRVGE